MNTEEFIKRCSEIHNNFYNYEKTEFVNTREKVVITCPEHGDFAQRASSHLQGSSCRKCGFDKSGDKQRSSLGVFLQKAQEIHGDRYDYSQVEYVNNKKKIKVYCHKHDTWFYPTPVNHINQRTRCPKCGDESGGLKQRSTDFIERCTKIHNGFYNYDKTNYVGQHEKVIIICPIHGDFEQEASLHLKGMGCRQCGNKKIGDSLRSSAEQFIKKSISIHGSDKFDYSRVNYVNNVTHVTLVCKKHNLEFEQLPSNHFKSIHSCPKCVNENNSLLKYTYDNFLERSQKIHSDLYDYSEVEYFGVCEKVKIVCKKHGGFMQAPYLHFNGQGCPNCSTSKGELAIKSILEANNIKFEQQKTFPDLVYKRNLKFDFYLPDYNTVIEFHGRQHYEPVEYFGGEEGFKETKFRDKIKKQYCKDSGITYVEITADTDLSSITSLFYSSDVDVTYVL